VEAPPKAARKALQPKSHRTPVKVTLTWYGGAEPWVRARTDTQDVMVPASVMVWELVLRLNGWTS
jgi:hypothetical protein